MHFSTIYTIKIMIIIRKIGPKLLTLPIFVMAYRTDVWTLICEMRVTNIIIELNSVG